MAVAETRPAIRYIFRDGIMLNGAATHANPAAVIPCRVCPDNIILDRARTVIYAATICRPIDTDCIVFNGTGTS